MALNNAQVKVGIVAYFEVAKLHADPKVKQPDSPATRDGPFVCFQKSAGLTAWTELTTQNRAERTEIKKEWVKGGEGKWGTESVYVNDGRTTYIGPSSSFVDASQTIDKYQPNTRPRFTQEGIDAALKAVRERGGSVIADA